MFMFNDFQKRKHFMYLYKSSYYAEKISLKHIHMLTPKVCFHVTYKADYPAEVNYNYYFYTHNLVIICFKQYSLLTKSFPYALQLF